MNRNFSRSRIHRDRRAHLIASLFAAGALAGSTATADAGFYQQIDLNTDSNANLTALGLPGDEQSRQSRSEKSLGHLA
jgi:hypothetical protein